VEREREDRPPDRHADQRVADVLARRAPQLLADIHVDPLRPVALLDEDRVAVLAERLTGRLRRIVGVVDRHLAVDRRVEGGAERDDSEGRCEGDEDDDADGESLLVRLEPSETGARAIEEATDESGERSERGGHTRVICEIEQMSCPSITSRPGTSTLYKSICGGVADGFAAGCQRGTSGPSLESVVRSNAEDD